MIHIEGDNYFSDFTTDSFSNSLETGYVRLKYILSKLGNTIIYMKLRKTSTSYVHNVYIEDSDKFDLSDYIETNEIYKYFSYADPKETTKINVKYVSLSELHIFTDKEIELLTTLYHNTLKNAIPVLDPKYYSSIITLMKKYKGYKKGKIERFNKIEQSITILLQELDKIKKLDNKFGFKNETVRKSIKQKTRKNT